ncbi:MAG: pyrroline-5-carboxylate reductase [Armatimonadetes bacterium]|nr:pyrroline-5-carboxylate reductase [Armatimonadota bacterium]
MGSALARGVIASGFCQAADVFAYDSDRSRSEKLSRETGCRVCASAPDAASEADVVVVCVKPAVVTGVLKEISPAVTPARIVISIAAAVKLETLEGALPAGTPVVRVMPNTPALVGRGAAGLAAGKSVSPAQIEQCVRLLESVGVAVAVDEKLMDAITGLSGSGPAFVYSVIEALADGGVANGLPRDVALKLAAQTVAGAAEMVLKSGQHPAVLRDQVTTPGGTTIAGLVELERAGLPSALIAAVQAATKRSAELGT